MKTHKRTIIGNGTKEFRGGHFRSRKEQKKAHGDLEAGAPGIYLHFDKENGALVYVGKAANLSNAYYRHGDRKKNGQEWGSRLLIMKWFSLELEKDEVAKVEAALIGLLWNFLTNRVCRESKKVILASSGVPSGLATLRAERKILFLELGRVHIRPQLKQDEHGRITKAARELGEWIELRPKKWPKMSLKPALYHPTSENYLGVSIGEDRKCKLLHTAFQILKVIQAEF